MIISSCCSGDGRLGHYGGSADVCRGYPGERHHLHTARPAASWSLRPHRKWVDCLRRQTCKQCLTMINVVEKVRKCLLALSSSLLHHLSLASKVLKLPILVEVNIWYLYSTQLTCLMRRRGRGHLDELHHLLRRQVGDQPPAECGEVWPRVLGHSLHRHRPHGRGNHRVQETRSQQEFHRVAVPALQHHHPGICSPLSSSV